MERERRRVFVEKILITCGVIIPLILILFFFGFVFPVLLLILAGVLVAVFFRGIATFIHTKWNLGFRWSLSIAMAGFVALIVLTGFLIAPVISKQLSQLKQQLPQSIEQLRQQTKDNKTVQNLFQDSDSIRKKISENQGKWAKKAFGALSSTLGILADIYVIFFIGIFFTLSPEPFVKGMVSLFPISSRHRASEVLNNLGKSLKKWLMGKLLSMAIVAILTIGGLLILDIPMAIVLGLIAGILSFIPNFGPIIAMVPAVFIGFTQGGNSALYVALLYIGVQAVESNLITPFIQKSMVSIPMALVLIAQIVLGVLSNGLGLILATPIAVMVIVLVKMLYIEDVLGDKSVEESH